MPLRAVVFDVYNTLFRNDTASWHVTFQEMCLAQALPIPPDELWTRWKTFEVQFRQTRTNLDRPEQSPPFKTYQAAWRQAFVDAFESLGIHGDPDQSAQMCVDALAGREPYPDTMSFLKHLEGRCKRAVLTNADTGSIMPLLERHNLVFDAVVTSEMVRAYKPDPRVFHRVLDEMGVGPREAIYVGDTLLDDIHGAKMAGLSAAWINRGGADPDPQLLPPDYVVTGLEELKAIIDTLERG